MVSIRTKSGGIQKSLVDQAIQTLIMLPDRSSKSLNSTESTSNLVQAETASC